MAGTSQIPLGSVLQSDHILIYSKSIIESLTILNADNAKGYDNIQLYGTHNLTIAEFYFLSKKLVELNIRRLSMISINFQSCSGSEMIRLLQNNPIGRPKLKYVEFDSCSYPSQILPIFIPHERLSFPFLQSITNIKVISWDENNTVRGIVSGRLEDNYRLQYFDTPDSDGSYINEEKYMDTVNKQKKHEFRAKIDKCLERNRRGHEKYISAVITILAIRKYRRSILSIIDKPVVLMICEMIAETSGTKIWIE